MTPMSHSQKIAETRQRVLEWLATMDAPEGGPEAKRFSSHHDVQRWPGMVLPATYDAVHCLRLLGEYQGGGRYDADRAAGVLNSYQTDTGAFRLPGMVAQDVFKREDPDYTREYIEFHATNYSFGALRSLGRRELRRFAFMDRYLSPEGLQSWIANRGWDDPWMEGNSFVNLGSFLIALAEDGNRDAANRLSELMDWLDAHQDEDTGFWGGGADTRRGLLVGMAGAMHTFHLYYYLDRPLPRMEQITAACLSLAQNELDGVSSACLDVDIIEVLGNCHRMGHRQKEIEQVFRKKLDDLLSFQNSDGGFSDEKSGVLRFDGWVRGYSEPQGSSNCFATWFRTATLGILDCVLRPDAAGDWTFRNTVGIGYYKK